MLSSRSLETIASKYQGMKNRLENIRETAEKTMGAVVQTVEVVGSTGLGGYLNGRYGALQTTNGSTTIDSQMEWCFHGLPVDACAGVALKGLAFFGAFGKYDEHAHNLGDGFLGSYGYRLGIKQGIKAAQKASQHSTSGYALGAGNPYARWHGTPMQAQAPWRGVG